MTTINLQPDESSSKDTLLSAPAPTGNYGTHVQLPAGNDGGLYYSLIQFDLSSVPVGATIVSATIRLWCESEASTLDREIEIFRSLVEWFEGSKAGSAPDPGENASTGQYRNANGSIPWGGSTIGGQADVDYVSTATDIVDITSANAFYDFDVTADVQSFVDLVNTNFGWWLRGSSIFLSRKVFSSSSNATASRRPQIIIEYLMLISGASECTATVAGSLSAIGYIAGNVAGQSSVSAEISSNQSIHALAQGTSAAQATGTLEWHIRATISGAPTVTGTLVARGEIVGTAVGTSIAAGDIVGIYLISGTATGTSAASALPDFAGKLRSQVNGTSSVSGLMWGKATGVATLIGCNPLPLLYVTDGSVKNNGQLNILNFLSEGSGFRLREGGWRPQITRYKEGGRFSSGPLSQGRRLKYRNFDNAIETFELAAISKDQDSLIEYMQELLAWQEAAADYWVSEYIVNPVYLVAKAARESNTRYAIIHMISVPELENPYAQPFYNTDHAAIGTLTPRIERGHWLSTPPGEFECVQVSSIRSWTVSGWESGS